MNSSSPGAFEKVELADGHILKFEAKDGEVSITIRNWQEKEIVLRFLDVVAFEAFSPMGEDLSHGVAEDKTALIDDACARTGATAEHLFCFSVWSAWRDTPIVRVVASGFEQMKPGGSS